MALRSVFFWATLETKPSLVSLISAFPQLGWCQAQGKYSMHVCKIRENLVLLLLFFNLSLAVLGLRHCTWLSLIMVSGALLSAAVHRLLIEVASLVSEHRFSSCGTLV